MSRHQPQPLFSVQVKDRVGESHCFCPHRVRRVQGQLRADNSRQALLLGLLLNRTGLHGQHRPAQEGKRLCHELLGQSLESFPRLLVLPSLCTWQLRQLSPPSLQIVLVVPKRYVLSEKPFLRQLELTGHRFLEELFASCLLCLDRRCHLVRCLSCPFDKDSLDLLLCSRRPTPNLILVLKLLH